jgi:hypothetical protein
VAGASWCAAQTPPPNGYSIQKLVLPGPDYVTTVNGQPTWSSFPFRVNSFGVIGSIQRANGNGADGWYANGTTIQQVQMTGAGYEYAGPGGILRGGAPQALVSPTNIVGSSIRYGTDGSSLGNDYWVYNGSSYTVVSPTGAPYELATPAGINRATMDTQVTETGHAFGHVARFGTAGEDLGQRAWSYFGPTGAHVTGLSGVEYEYAVAGGAYHFDQFNEGNDTGHVNGITRRYSPAGVDLGADAWHFDGTTTTRVGFSGAGYEYAAAGGTYRGSYATRLGAGGISTGITERYAGSGTYLGEDAWVYDGNATQPIGFTGGIYQHTANAAGIFRDSYSDVVGKDGRVLGTSQRYGADGTDLGADAWAYHNGTTTALPGLSGAGYEYTTPAGTKHYSFPQEGNANGKTLGISYRFTPGGDEAGRDTWLHDSNATVRVNPIGGEYEYNGNGAAHRMSGGVLSDSGRVWGDSERFNSAGEQIGRDAWTSDGQTTHVISLIGGIHEYAYSGGGNVRVGGVEHFSESGFATGFNARFGPGGLSLGRSGWFYDADDDLTVPLIFSQRNDGFAYTESYVVTETGVVLGEYALYDGADPLGLRAFWWSEQAGLHDLGSLTDLAANGWDRLRIAQMAAGTTFTGAPQFIAGIGLSTNENPDFGATGFLLSANVPEPSVATMLGLGVAPLMVGRRRRSVTIPG